MKNRNLSILSTLLMGVSALCWGQNKQDTLTHYDIFNQTLTAKLKASAVNAWGYEYGHGGNGVNGVAEKYYVKDEMNVDGIIIYLDEMGAANTNNKATFLVYNTLNNGFPTVKASDSVTKTISSLSLDKLKPSAAFFSHEVKVKDTFMVSFQFPKYDYVETKPGFKYPEDSLGPYQTINRTEDPDPNVAKRNAVLVDGIVWLTPEEYFGDTINFLISPIISEVNDTTDTNLVSLKPVLINGNGFQLYNHYPNPAKQKLTIRYNLSHNSPVYVNILDMKGRSIKTIHVKDQQKGMNAIELNLEGLDPGQYIYLLRTDRDLVSRKFIKQ